MAASSAAPAEHAFDIAIPHPALHDVASTASQSDILEAVLNAAPYNSTHNVNDTPETFFAKPRITRDLNFISSAFHRGDRRTAIECLAKRHQIDWKSSEHVIANDNPMLSWSVHQHHIDMTVFVAKGLGLGLIIPPIRDHDFLFEFDFSQRQRTFSPKFARLGFDPENACLWIGHYYSAQTYIAWAPNDALPSSPHYNESLDRINVSRDSRATTLATIHYRITVMFFAFVIEKLGLRGITVFDEYPDVQVDAEFKHASNIL